MISVGNTCRNPFDTLGTEMGFVLEDNGSDLDGPSPGKEPRRGHQMSAVSEKGCCIKEEKV